MPDEVRERPSTRTWVRHRTEGSEERKSRVKRRCRWLDTVDTTNPPGTRPKHLGPPPMDKPRVPYNLR